MVGGEGGGKRENQTKQKEQKREAAHCYMRTVWKWCQNCHVTVPWPALSTDGTGGLTPTPHNLPDGLHLHLSSFWWVLRMTARTNRSFLLLMLPPGAATLATCRENKSQKSAQRSWCRWHWQNIDQISKQRSEFILAQEQNTKQKIT